MASNHISGPADTIPAVDHFSKRGRERRGSQEEEGGLGGVPETLPLRSEAIQGLAETSPNLDIIPLGLAEELPKGICPHPAGRLLLLDPTPQPPPKPPHCIQEVHSQQNLSLSTEQPPQQPPPLVDQLDERPPQPALPKDQRPEPLHGIQQETPQTSQLLDPNNYQLSWQTWGSRFVIMLEDAAPWAIAAALGVLQPEIMPEASLAPLLETYLSQTTIELWNLLHPERVLHPQPTFLQLLTLALEHVENQGPAVQIADYMQLLRQTPSYESSLDSLMAEISACQTAAVHNSQMESKEDADEALILDEATSLIKTGKHSITATNITSELLIDDESTNSGPANFYTYYGQALLDLPDHFPVIHHNIDVVSFICESAAGGGFEVPHAIQAHVIIGRDIFLDANVINQASVQWAPAVLTATYRTSELDAYTNGGRISEKYVTNAIQPELYHNTNIAITRQLASLIELGMDCFDMSGMYAKLIFYALLRDTYTYIDVVPAANAYPAGAFPWLNLTAAGPAPDIGELVNAISNGAIVLLEGRDIDQNELSEVAYLMHEGARFNIIEGAALDATYISWPSIPIMILSNRAQQAVPAPIVMTSSRILAFSRKLASRRREWKYWLKGLYMATEIMGTRLVLNAIENESRPLRSNLSTDDFHIPQPYSSNYLLNLLTIAFADVDERSAEVDSFFTLPPTSRVRCLTLFNAVLATATTTLLYDMNITVQHLVHWNTAAADMHDGVMIVIDDVFNDNELNRLQPYEPICVSQARKAFKLWLGVGVANHLWVSSTWQGGFGSNLHALVNWADQIDINTAPRLFNPMIIDNWLLQRPLEWGVLGPKPACDFSREVINSGAVANQGWFSSLGSDLYGQRTLGQSPMKLVVYGVQALTAIHQLLRPVDGAVIGISQETCPWAPDIKTGNKVSRGWVAAVPIVPNPLFYIDDLQLYQPCIFQTYNYQTHSIQALAITAAQLPLNELHNIANAVGQNLDLVGYALRRLSFTSAPPTPSYRKFDFTGLGALRARLMAGKSGDPSKELNSKEPQASTAPKPEANPATASLNSRE